jgi:hypothetical protein
MKIVFFYADNTQEWNCSNWRVVIPAEAMARAGHKVNVYPLADFALNAPEAETACKEADYIIVERMYVNEVVAQILHWREMGKTVIGTFDDAYNLVKPDNPAHAFWLEGRPQASVPDVLFHPRPIVQFVWALGAMNGATTPSKVLCEDWQPYTEMRVVPNYLDLAKYEDVPKPKHNGIIIGWGGSLSHMQSFKDSGLISAMQRVAMKRQNVRFMFIGDRRVYEQMPLESNRKIFTDFVPFALWPHTVVNFDIGLAPLCGIYDDRRSWIKPLEYMVSGIPWIGSQSPAYEDLKEYGILTQNTVGAWERHLLDMIDHLPRYTRQAQGAPREYALHQGIDENLDKVIATYEELAKWPTQSQTSMASVQAAAK